jgi:predicted nucleic acid-binding protein
MLYIDTSVLVSALTNEADTTLSQTWLAGRETSELAISDWTVTEFASALSTKMRIGSLEAKHRAAALSTFTRLSAESMRVLSVAREDFRTAARYADLSQLNLRAGDALHLAICANHGATLCTLDQRLAKAAPQVGVGSELLSARQG